MPEGTIRLAFLADVQIGCMATFSGVDDGDIARFARSGMVVRRFPHTDSLNWDLDRFVDAVHELNELEPDLVVIGGDMVDDISRSDQLDGFRAVAAGSERPLHFAPGNHDICADAAVPTAESLEWYRSSFGAEHSVVSTGLSDSTTLTVAMVNSAVLDQPRKLPGSFDAEMQWLEAELANRPPGPTIVVSHHPPFVGDPDEAPNYWNIPPERRQPFLDLLVDQGVDLVLCGHRHLNDSTQFRGVEIVTTAAVGFPLGTDPPGFRLVDVDDSGISHTYYPLADPAWDAIGGPPEPVSG